jgi:hypothetical protein
MVNSVAEGTLAVHAAESVVEIAYVGGHSDCVQLIRLLASVRMGYSRLETCP